MSTGFIYLIVGIVALHFIIGAGWLVYKINNSKPPNKHKEEDLP